MTVEDNKDIDITYNYLNMPVSIVRNTGSTGLIKHYYAGANKVRMEVYSDAAGSTLQKTYDYLGSSVYIKEAAEDAEMEFMGMPEGRVLFARKVLCEAEDPERGNIFKYEYQLRDHLGNLRVSCRCHEPNRDETGHVIAEGETGHGFIDVAAVQFADYDPWGLSFESPTVRPSEVENLQHRYLYNGKEKLQDLEVNLYEYGFRSYDPLTARWTSVDPLTEHMPSWSAYKISFNNALKYKDDFGLSPSDIVFNGVDCMGNSVGLARVVTDKVNVEYNSDILVSPNFENQTIDLSNAESFVDSETPDAFSINLSGEAAYRLGVQGELSLIGMVKGPEVGEWGLALAVNGLTGIDAGITGSVSFYYSSIPIIDFGLNQIVGAEIGVQADLSSVASRTFTGFNTIMRNPFYDSNSGSWTIRSPIQLTEVYTGFSSGITRGALKAGVSAYLSYSEYIYKSKKGWFPK